MPKYYYINSTTQIQLPDKPFAEGGEGEIYIITSPNKFQGYCAKIIFKNQRSKNKFLKIQHLIKNPPRKILNTNGIRICWPLHLIYDASKQPVGFIMPIAYPQSIQVYELTKPKIRSKYAGLLNKFEKEKNTDALIRRIKICINIAHAVYLIHQNNEYVFVDLKPQNILFSPDGKISLVDLDSIQITKNNKVLFFGKVGTPEYLPPEGFGIDPSKCIVPVSHDHFSLAVITYQIIVGCHPFSCSTSGAYSHLSEKHELIKNGLFPFGSRKAYTKPSEMHKNNYNILPQELKNIFLLAFDGSFYNPKVRPTSNDIGRTLFSLLPQTSQKKKHSWIMKLYYSLINKRN